MICTRRLTRLFYFDTKNKLPYSGTQAQTAVWVVATGLLAYTVLRSKTCAHNTCGRDDLKRAQNASSFTDLYRQTTITKVSLQTIDTVKVEFLFSCCLTLLLYTILYFRWSLSFAAEPTNLSWLIFWSSVLHDLWGDRVCTCTPLSDHLWDEVPVD